MTLVYFIFGIIISSACVNSQTCTFEQDIDYFGNDLNTTPVYLTSSDLCCLTCQATSGCQIWTYITATSACWLKRSVGSTRITSVGRVSGVSQAATATSTVATTTTVSTISGTCSFEANIDYIGNDLNAFPVYLTSSDLCCLTCQATAGCQIWTYVTATTACWLKRQVGALRVVSAGRNSGVNQAAIVSTAATATTTASTTASPLTNTCSFEQDIDYFGNDLNAYPVYLTSSDLCCLTCQATPECQIWTYITSTTACWLKRSVGSLRVTSVGRVSGVKQTNGGVTASTITTTLTATVPTTTKRVACLIEVNINYPGNDLSGTGNFASASDCCNYCGATSGCAGWSFFVTYNYCFLKTAVPSPANREAYPGMISGRVTIN